MSTATNQKRMTMTPANVAAMFFGRVRKSADREAFRKLDGDRWYRSPGRRLASR